MLLALYRLYNGVVMVVCCSSSASMSRLQCSNCPASIENKSIWSLLTSIWAVSLVAGQIHGLNCKSGSSSSSSMAKHLYMPYYKIEDRPINALPSVYSMLQTARPIQAIQVIAQTQTQNLSFKTRTCRCQNATGALHPHASSMRAPINASAKN